MPADVMRMQAGQQSGLQRVLDALNVLGSTKWCVLATRSCFEPRSLTMRAPQAHQRRGADNYGASLEGRRRRGGDSRGSGADAAAACLRRALTRRARPQDAPVPIMPALTFTLHSNNIQQLCYGGKPSVRFSRLGLVALLLTRSVTARHRQRRDMRDYKLAFKQVRMV